MYFYRTDDQRQSTFSKSVVFILSYTLLKQVLNNTKTCRYEEVLCNKLSKLYLNPMSFAVGILKIQILLTGSSEKMPNHSKAKIMVSLILLYIFYLLNIRCKF